MSQFSIKQESHRINNFFLKLGNKPAVFLIVAFIIDFIPSTAILAFFYFVLEIRSHHSEPPTGLSSYVFALGVISIGPLVETYMMIFIFFVLRKFLRSLSALVLISAIIWALLHGAFSWSWGFLVFWGFCVLSFTFLFWDAKSRKKAILMTTVLHAMTNMPGAIEILYESSAR